MIAYPSSHFTSTMIYFSSLNQYMRHLFSWIFIVHNVQDGKMTNEHTAHQVSYILDSCYRDQNIVYTNLDNCHNIDWHHNRRDKTIYKLLKINSSLWRFVKASIRKTTELLSSSRWNSTTASYTPGPQI